MSYPDTLARLESQVRQLEDARMQEARERDRLRSENEALKAADRDHASARNGMETRLREEFARKLLEASQVCADGYSSGSEALTNSDREINEKCAIAASNVGWFALRALGFSNEKIKELYAAYRQS